MMIQKMVLPLTVVGPMFAILLGAASSYMVTKDRVEEAARKASETAIQVEKLRDQAGEDRERLKGIETSVQYFGQALERIERRLGTK